MATITASGKVLKIVGADVVTAENDTNRAGLKAALFSGTNPVGNLSGKVDFVVCFVSQGKRPANFGAADPNTDPQVQPRPLRGIAHMYTDLATQSAAELGGLLGGGVGHELAHYWLVPGAGRIQVENGEVETPSQDQIATALEQGLDYPPYPIVGGWDCHWSPFINVENSPMEGPNLSAPVKTKGLGLFGISGRYDQVVGQDKVGPAFTLPGLGEIQTRNSFCSLERWIVGCYNRVSPLPLPSFLVLVPKWSFPFPFEAGLYVRLDSGETWYVGFHEGPHEVCAHKISSPTPDQMIGLPADPLDPYIRVGARVVQRASSVDLQVRLWAPRTFGYRSRKPPFRYELWRCAVSPTDTEVMGDVPQGAAGVSDSWTGWKTLASRSGRVQRMGLSSRMLAGDYFHTLLSAKLCLHQGGVTTAVPTPSLQHDVPVPGPVLLPNGSLMMPYRIPAGNPPNTYYQETATAQCAPKLLCSAPAAGEFAFGGVIHLDRCVQVPYAGGLKAGKKMVGRAESVRVNRFVLPWSDADRARRQAEPLGGAYKVLFCLASRTDNITPAMLDNLDLVRQGWEIYSPQLTGRRWDGSVF